MGHNPWGPTELVPRPPLALVVQPKGYRPADRIFHNCHVGIFGLLAPTEFRLVFPRGSSIITMVDDSQHCSATGLRRTRLSKITSPRSSNRVGSFSRSESDTVYDMTWVFSSWLLTSCMSLRSSRDETRV